MRRLARINHCRSIWLDFTQLIIYLARSFLVFHGGSGSSKEEIHTAVQNGVVKMNVDTDTQFAYLVGMRVSLAVLVDVCSQH